MGAGLLSRLGIPCVTFEGLPDFVQSACTSLQFHSHCVRVLISPHRCQHLLLFVYFILFYFIHPSQDKVITHCGFDFCSDAE